MGPLLVHLRRIRRRLLLVRAVETGLAGALGAALAAAFVTLLRILLPHAVPQTAAYPALPLVLLPCGFVLGAAVRLAAGVSLRRTAMAADAAAGLQERLTTALEVIERSSAGALDAHLLEDARALAASLDTRSLSFARSLSRTARLAAVAILVLAATAFIPSRGGPAVSAQAAQRAMGALEEMAAKESLAPVIEAAVRKAIGTLQQNSVRQADANQATADILRAMERLDQARRQVADNLNAAGNPDLADLAQKLAKGDLEGARKAAERLGLSLSKPAGAGGLSEADREHVSAGLSGAAQAARREDLLRLAAEMEAAAAAVRKSEAETVAALQRVAEAMADSLRPPSPGDVAAVAQARSTMQLPAWPVQPVAAVGAPPPATPTSNSTGAQAVEAAASPTLRPEDRDLVRRYFAARGGVPK
jgi:hypothetical protein